MKTVCYALFSTSILGTSASLASADIARPGKIVGFTIGLTATGGAGIGYHEVVGVLNVQGNTVYATNNPQRECCIGKHVGFTPNATGAAGTTELGGLGIPVSVGDRITLGLSITGTAPASGIAHLNVYVHED